MAEDLNIDFGISGIKKFATRGELESFVLGERVSWLNLIKSINIRPLPKKRQRY